MIKEFTLENLHEVVELFYNQYKKYSCWCFYGEMGSGKTTFINTLCTFLKVSDKVSSPTYSIINEYYSPIVGTIKHMDWYRLKDIDEAFEAGVEDALLSANLCLIEWPEKFPELIPELCCKIQLETISSQQHRISFLS